MDSLLHDESEGRAPCRPCRIRSARSIRLGNRSSSSPAVEPQPNEERRSRSETNPSQRRRGRSRRPNQATKSVPPSDARPEEEDPVRTGISGRELEGRGIQRGRAGLEGRFTESDDVSKSLAKDAKDKGDRGDQKRRRS